MFKNFCFFLSSSSSSGILKSPLPTFTIFYHTTKNYLLLILPQRIKNILINGVITQDNFIPSSHQPNHQGTLFQHGPVLTAEVVDLVLNGFHFGDVVVEGDHVGARAGRVPAG